MTLLADLPELGSLDRKAVASLAGLAPIPTRAEPAPRVALVAIARKIVVAANGMLKSGQPWQKPA